MGRPIILLILLLIGTVNAAPWDASSYPNPTTQSGAKKCGLRSAGQLCDPDGILSESERYKVNHDLSRLESRTYQEFGRNFCEKKGITTILALAKNVKGGTEADVRRMATELRQVWSLDQQCMKGIVIVVSIDDRKFWVSRDNKVPVYAGEFNEILNAQTELFRQKKYPQALTNIIQQTAEKSLSKQGQLPAAPADDGSRAGGGRKEPTGGKGSGSGFKMPNIPIWLILAIVCVVIPTLICCCCIYCCCCRNKSGGNRRQGPSDEDPEAPQSSGGGFGDRIRSIAGGAGGGMLMSMIQNCFRNRGSGGGMSGGDQPPAGGPARGGYVPPRPQAEEGKGLYPSKEVQDEGAGGGW